MMKQFLVTVGILMATTTASMACGGGYTTGCNGGGISYTPPSEPTSEPFVVFSLLAGIAGVIAVRRLGRKA